MGDLNEDFAVIDRRIEIRDWIDHARRRFAEINKDNNLTPDDK